MTIMIRLGNRVLCVYLPSAVPWMCGTSHWSWDVVTTAAFLRDNRKRYLLIGEPSKPIYLLHFFVRLSILLLLCYWNTHVRSSTRCSFPSTRLHNYVECHWFTSRQCQPRPQLRPIRTCLCIPSAVSPRWLPWRHGIQSTPSRPLPLSSAPPPAAECTLTPWRRVNPFHTRLS